VSQAIARVRQEPAVIFAQAVGNSQACAAADIAQHDDPEPHAEETKRRRIVYPSFSDPSQERGMLLASYTWAQDALRWGSMNEEDRVEQALEDVAKIHPEIVEEFEVGASHAWYSDPYAGGAFALFEPEQQTLLQDHIVAPEGRIHFAGEHCSLYHAWIQGALESGIRAANAIHQAPAAMTARTDREPAGPGMTQPR